jgi:hypothetical protein
MFAQRMRATLSLPAGLSALLQPALPGGGAEVVTVEGTATIPGDGGLPTETERQSRRYRERVKSRKPPEAEVVSDTARVIAIEPFFDYSCDRPGCYESFVLQRRSPLQHFCSHDCRRALERVQDREQRWKQPRDLIRRYRSAGGDRLHSACLMQLEFHQLDRKSASECAIRHGSGGGWRRWPAAASKRPS